MSRRTTSLRSTDTIAILAGPMANIAVLLLHPWSPLRYVPEIVWNTPSLGLREAVLRAARRCFVMSINPDVEVCVPLPNGDAVVIAGPRWDVEKYVKDLKKKHGMITDPPKKNPFTDESYLDHVPFIGVLRLSRDSSVWMMSFVIGIGNLLPIPPLDGAHLFYAAADPQERPTSSTGSCVSSASSSCSSVCPSTG